MELTRSWMDQAVAEFVTVRGIAGHVQALAEDQEQDRNTISDVLQTQDDLNKKVKELQDTAQTPGVVEMQKAIADLRTDQNAMAEQLIELLKDREPTISLPDEPAVEAPNISIVREALDCDVLDANPGIKSCIEWLAQHGTLYCELQPYFWKVGVAGKECGVGKETFFAVDLLDAYYGLISHIWSWSDNAEQ